jgi:hypothetical protein
MNEVKQVLCDEPVRQRGVDRFRIDTVGAIHSRGSVDHEVSIINISTAGCLIRSDRILPIGSRQTLTIRGIGFVEGRVVWLDRPKVCFGGGVRFRNCKCAAYFDAMALRPARMISAGRKQSRCS